MNTLPPEWWPVPADRPPLLPPMRAARRRVGTSWRACPLSSAWDRAIVTGDHRLLQTVDRVASEWNRVVHRTRLRWLSRAPRRTLRFSTEDYAALTAVLRTDVLERTLGHLGVLRRQPRPRHSLAGLALLERVETAVATDLEGRLVAVRRPRARLDVLTDTS